VKSGEITKKREKKTSRAITLGKVAGLARIAPFFQKTAEKKKKAGE